MIRSIFNAVAFALLIAADVWIGLSLPTAKTQPLPSRWVEPRRDWIVMYQDNRGWLQVMERSITAPMFVGSDEPPPDTPD